MKTTKQNLSDEISKGKRKKNRRKLVIAFVLLTAFDIGILLVGYFLGTKDLKGWLMAGIVIVTVSSFLAVMTSAGDKEKGPTDDEIKNLAKKKVEEMDVSEDINGPIDEELRESLKKIINE